MTGFLNVFLGLSTVVGAVSLLFLAGLVAVLAYGAVHQWIVDRRQHRAEVRVAVQLGRNLAACPPDALLERRIRREIEACDVALWELQIGPGVES